MKSLILAIIAACFVGSLAQTESSATAAAPAMAPTKFFTSLRESFHDCSTRCNCVGCISCLGVTIYQFEANDKTAPPIYWCRPGLEDSQDDLHIGKVVYKALLRDKLPKAVRSVFPPSLKKLPGMTPAQRYSPHHMIRSRRSTSDVELQQGMMMRQGQSQAPGPDFDPLDPSKNQFGQATHQITVPNVVVQPGTSQGTENKQASLLRMPVSADEVKNAIGSAPDPSLINGAGFRQGAQQGPEPSVDAAGQAGQQQTGGLQQPSEQQNFNQSGTDQQEPNQSQPGVDQQGSNQTFSGQAVDQQQPSAVQQPAGATTGTGQITASQPQPSQPTEVPQPSSAPAQQPAITDQLLQQQQLRLQQQVQQQQFQLQQQKANAEQQLANQFVSVQQQAQNLRNQAFQQHQNLQQLQQQETLLQQQNFHQQNNAVLQQQSLQQQNNVQQQQNLQQQKQNLEEQQTKLQQGPGEVRTDTSATSPNATETGVEQSPPGLANEVPLQQSTEAPLPTSSSMAPAQDQFNQTLAPAEQTSFGQNSSTSPSETPTSSEFNNSSTSSTSLESPSTSVSGSAFSTAPSGVRVSGFASSSNQSFPLAPVNQTLQAPSQVPLESSNQTSDLTPSAPVLSNVTLTTSNGNVTIDIQSAGTPGSSNGTSSSSSSSSVPPVPEDTSAASAQTSDLTPANTTSAVVAPATPSNETTAADQDSMTIVVVAPSKVLTLVQGKNIAVEVMNEPIQNCTQDTQSDQVSNQKRIELLKSAITALQFTLSKLEQESPLESVQVLLTSRCQGANGSIPQSGEPASIKITPNPQLPPGQVRIDVQQLQTTHEDQQKQPMTNFEAAAGAAAAATPCSTMDIERYKTEMSTAVYVMYQNEPTLFVFINNARCVGVFRQSKENSIVPAETLFPEFPWKSNFFKASVYYNDVLYVFDASTPQRVWAFEFDPARNNFKVASEGVVSLEEFARSGCLIQNLPPGFRVHAAAQATTAEPSCVLFDEHRTSVTTPIPEARGLSTAISKVADLQFLQSIKALFTWHDQQSPSNYYVFGSNDELYRVFRGTRGGSSWRTSTHVLVPYEKYPY